MLVSKNKVSLFWRAAETSISAYWRLIQGDAYFWKCPLATLQVAFTSHKRSDLGALHAPLAPNIPTEDFEMFSNPTRKIVLWDKQDGPLFWKEPNYEAQAKTPEWPKWGLDLQEASR